MYCKHCGKKISDDANFCIHCGKHQKTISHVANEKNMFFALLFSLFFMGLGIYYAGNKKKGFTFFVVLVMLDLIRYTFRTFPTISMTIRVFSMIITLYGLYETYKEVKISNGESNPNLIEDLKDPNQFENIAALVAMGLLMLIYSLLVNVFLY